MNVEEIFGDKVECALGFKRKNNPIARIFSHARYMDKHFGWLEDESKIGRSKGKHVKGHLYLAYLRLPEHIRRYVKWCDSCGVAKPRTELYFSPNLNNKDKLLCKCRNCSKGRECKETMKGINAVMSHGINSSLWSGKQGHHWEKFVPYTLDDLIKHLESGFQPGMHWGNYGQGGGKNGEEKWQIDHIKPRSLFRFLSPDDPQFLECWGLQNLRPLWAKDNAAKRDKYPYIIPESRQHLYPYKFEFDEDDDDNYESIDDYLSRIFLTENVKTDNKTTKEAS